MIMNKENNMKSIFKMTALLLLMIFGSAQTMAKDYELKCLNVSGVSSYSGPYISLYLVHGTKLFGQEITINKVYKVLASQKITGSDEMSFGPFSMKQNWSNFRGPNYVVAVIHSSARHALNRHGVIDGTPTLFEAPEFLNAEEQVQASSETKALQIRGALSLKELDDGKLLKL